MRLANHAEATFWYVLPSLPMFLAIPAVLRAGAPFWLALAAGIAMTAALYLLMTALLARFGVRCERISWATVSRRGSTRFCIGDINACDQ